MREDFTREAEVALQRSVVWDVLNDVDALASCSTRLAEVTSVVADQEWQLVLSDRVGPMTLSAPMSVTVVERTPTEQVRIVARGHDRLLGTRLEVEASVGCAETPTVDQTRVTLVGSYDVSGKAANLGSTIVRRQAKAMIDEFWQNFSARLDQDDAARRPGL